MVLKFLKFMICDGDDHIFKCDRSLPIQLSAGFGWITEEQSGFSGAEEPWITLDILGLI
jgi:hypothetical protein